MDAEELLRGDAPFVAATSAWWRAATLRNNLGSLLQRAILDERFWITPIVRMEILYSARTSSEYAEVELELDALRILRNDRAGAAAEHGGLAVPHRDVHFERLAEVLAFQIIALHGP